MQRGERSPLFLELILDADSRALWGEFESRGQGPGLSVHQREFPLRFLTLTEGDVKIGEDVLCPLEGLFEVKAQLPLVIDEEIALHERRQEVTDTDETIGLFIEVRRPDNEIGIFVQPTAVKKVALAVPGIILVSFKARFDFVPGLRQAESSLGMVSRRASAPPWGSLNP